MSATTFLFEADAEDARGCKRRLLEVLEGGSVTLGGPGSVLRSDAPLARAHLLADGALELEPLAADATLAGAPCAGRAPFLPGVELRVGRLGLTLRTPPYLKGLHAPAPLRRWTVELALAHPGGATPYTLERATGLVFSVGRHDLNALRLPVDSLARRHAGFFVDWRGQAWVSDLGSGSGTWRAATRERLDTWSPWRAGEELVVGGSVTVRLLSSPR